MEQEKLLDEFGAVSFYLDELNLYLDTHPSDKHALETYRKYKEKREMLLAEYTKKYGPMNHYDVDAENYWDWISKPWPWMGED